MPDKPVRRRVITERDVRRAARDGAKQLDASASAVTPSAYDVAARLGVTLAGAVAVSRSRARTDERSGPAPAPVPNGGAAPDERRALAIAIGADHGGVALKDGIAARLREIGHRVTDHGTVGSAAVDYPDFAAAVARAVATGQARFGIMVDGAGIGSCMAANKIRGVRAAMCYDVTTAINAREHNDANVLTLGAGLICPRLALAIVETFLATPFAGGRHAARVAKIEALLKAD